MIKRTCRYFFFITLMGIMHLSSLNAVSQSNNTCVFASDLNFKELWTCGKIVIPENHSNPKGRKISIAYIIIKSKNEASDYPLIHLTGGPGGRTLTNTQIQRFVNSPFREHRDIILFDQRGIGFSSALSNISEQLFQILAKNLNEQEELKAMSGLLNTAKAKIESEGATLSNYNTFQNAQDVGVIMESLGYEKYNIMGGSYGTTLGRLVQDFYPDKLHSAIYNAPSPIDIDFLTSRLQSYKLALERIFDWCNNDTNCNTVNPNLKSTYTEVIKTLKTTSIEIPIDENSFFINAQDAEYLIRRVLYANNSRRLVPAVINAFKAKNLDILRNIIQLEQRIMNDMNMSMFLAVSSYEQVESDVNLNNVDHLYDTLGIFPARLGFFDALYRSGRNWHGKKISSTDQLYKSSKVPTLITVNYYDPVTPPENGYLFMKTLSNGQLLVLDEGGHGSISNPDCRDNVFKAFMKNPKAKLDTSCLNIK